jgi:triacylglycerol lipase
LAKILGGANLAPHQQRRIYREREEEAPMAPLEATQPPSAPPITDVQMHDALASANRLWVRGRLVLPPPPVPIRRRGWWKRWRLAPAPPAPALTAHIQTQVSGITLEANVPVRPDGQFEVSFESELPSARRGWRMARHQIRVAGQTLRACNVVLTAANASDSGLVVVLPVDFTYDAPGVQRLTESALAARLTALFRVLQEEHGGSLAVYYLCCVPPDGHTLQPELALATTSLGWPSGPIVLMPTLRAKTAEALTNGLDRLRWLYAGRLALVVLNQEPAAESALAAAVKDQPDRARVSRYVSSVEDLRTLRINGEKHPASPAPWIARPTRARAVPRHPVVFCHGMLAMTMLRMQIPEDTNYFSHLRSFLRERGIEALYPNVEPTGGVAARAEQLRDLIRHWTDEPVNLVAHSMGGLDARYLITHLGMAAHVASLTTLSTPHRGTAVADWFCLNFRQRVPLLLTLQAFGINVDGFRDCRTDICRTFNERTPDAPGVRYFSYTGAVPSSRVSPLLRRAWNILTPIEGPNDGLVSVRSGAWGEVVGMLAVDHFAQTPDGLFVRPSENFDALTFYLRLIENLAHRGL